MVLDGKLVKNTILDEIRAEVKSLTIKPKLVVVQASNDAASDMYVRQKKIMCDYVGYEYEHIKLGDNVNTDDILSIITRLNNDLSVTGILIQLPLPDLIDADKVINSIDPFKDVDALTNVNRIKLLSGQATVYSCTALGIMELLDRYNIDVGGKHAVIVGRSNLIGKPVSMMMLNKDATVTVCHSKTNSLSEYTKSADLLISAVGKPKFITKEMVKDGSVIIDVGINYTKDGIFGDVDFDSVKDKVSYITPVPGGVGPMTVAMLAKNILNLYKKQNRNQCE